MPKERPLANRIINLAVFILLETAALLLLSNNNTLQRLWIARVSHGFMAKTWGASQSVKNYFSLKGQNDELALENERLREALRSYEISAREADPSLRPVLKDNGFKYTPATIIKSGTSSQHNYLILDKGSEDGIVENSGIITPKGVIGIIDAVSKHYSFAISFLNSELSISARIDTSGAVGPLAWDGLRTDEGVLKEIPLQFKYNQGDTVYTSGYSAIFPPDIPLGVAGEAKVINGATNEIRVKLFQDHSALKYVTIIENTLIKEIEEIENSDMKKKEEGKR
ncbi:MAG: rod shape-determining protein MreC [Bacteroidales bacterium]|nr:rod shape-determining protein MreC [Bacteroidales bacterium]MBP3269699.1 rod shape-determining protein MreC [Bacteroidales bacterium]